MAGIEPDTFVETLSRLLASRPPGWTPSQSSFAEALELLRQG